MARITIDWMEDGDDFLVFNAASRAFLENTGWLTILVFFLENRLETKMHIGVINNLIW